MLPKLSSPYKCLRLCLALASMVAQMVKNLPEMGRPCFDPWIRNIPWRRDWLPTLVFLPGESHELRNLAGYNPQGRRESDMTEQLTLSRLETELRQNIKCSPFLESVLYYPRSMTKSERMSLQIHAQQHENFPPLWK